MANDVDVVITWVDNTDSQWISEYIKFGSKSLAQEISGKVRFEDTGSFKYLFRGIEKFMPWVRKIHLVTCGHTPKWLNIDHPRINVVFHSDIFPDSSVLPVFNSGAIEMNFHHIKGLSEKFIYFNDDSFVIRSLSEKYFFTDNKPNDFFMVRSLEHSGIFTHKLHSCMQIINTEVTRNSTFKTLCFSVVKQHYPIRRKIRSILLLLIERQIPLIVYYHNPQPHLKSNFIDVENNYPNEVNNTRKNRFREPLDLNQYVFRYWGLIKSNYCPFNVDKSIALSAITSAEMLSEKLASLKNKKQIALFCTNESPQFKTNDYSRYKQILASFLDEKLGDKSSFEIGYDEYK